jgi:hopanoid biosynthesis associated protein HpnK
VSARQLIVSADDMGLTEGHNRAIVQAHTDGVLTSASLLACGAAFDDAVARAGDLPSLGIGVHLTLLEGTPVRPPAAVPDLVAGRHPSAFGTSLGRLLFGVTVGQIARAQVRDEWGAQLDRVLDSGLRVTHIDSHRHVHMHPQLLGIALALAAEAGISRMRLSRPPRPFAGYKTLLLGLLAAWAAHRMAREGVRFPAALLGLEASGRMTVERTVEAIRAPWHGVRELMTHPAFPGPELAHLAACGYRWIEGYRFGDELDALCAPQVRATLQEEAVELVSYERFD